MILVITKENEKLISEVLQESNINDFQILTSVNNLYNFISTELRSLNNFNELIIDISSITDTENQIIDTIVTLKTIYQSIRITIMAIGYSEGNTLLSKLFSESIFNFVTAKDYLLQKEELVKCLTVGNTYSDSIRFRYNDNTKDVQKGKVIIKKEYTKRIDSVSIGIVGTQSHIGVTTQAILITMFLKSLNMNVCYICSNDKDEIIKYLSSSLFKGVGKTLATHIVDRLGEDALLLIKEDKHCLDLVKGMTELKRDTIFEVLTSQDFDQEVMQFFMGHGISMRHLGLIQATYKEKTLQILQNKY